MDYRHHFNEIMTQTANLALATSVNHIPNVRIVNFGYDLSKPGLVYFTTVRDNPKVAEFGQNDRVALTTVPATGNAHVRSSNARVQKSPLSIDAVKELFLQQVPGFEEALSQIGDLLEVYEIHLKEAAIILDFEHEGKIAF